MEREMTTDPSELLADVGWVHRLARSLVGDAAAAQDVAQDTWVAALTRGPSPRPPRRWLAAVARNFARQRARGDASRRGRESDARGPEPLPTPAELALRVERQRVLAEALAALDEPFRAMVLLRYVHGLEPSEIARRLELPAGTVRRRIHVGLARLRTDLDRRFDGERGAWIAALLPLARTAPAELGGSAAAAAPYLGWLAMKIALALVVSAALVLSAFALLRRAELDAPAQLASAVPATSAPSDAPPSAAAPPPAAPAAPSERTSLERLDVAAERGTATRVELRGTVAAAGAGADPTLEAFALREPLRYDQLAPLLDRAAIDADEREELDALLVDRAPVGADSRFVLRVPPGIAHVALRGRTLYADSTVAFDVRGDTDVELRPERGAWVRGVVRAPDATAPLAGATSVHALAWVGALDLAAGMLGSTLATEVAVAGDGSFELRALPATADYRLLALHDELAAGRALVDALAPGAVRDVELVFAPGGVVAGRVVDELGEPLAGARVEARVPGRWFGFDDVTVRAGTTEADGAFALGALPAGALALRASREGRLESAGARVELTERGRIDDVELVLERGATLAGRVSAPADDGQRVPAAGARVRVHFDRGFMAGDTTFGALRGAQGEARADADGRFAVGGLGPGPFVVEVRAVRAEGGDDVVYRARRDGVRPADGELELLLAPPLALRGVVADERGVAPESFRVLATRVTEGALGPVGLERREASFRATQGRFELVGVQPGRWRLDVVAPGLVATEAPIVALPGAGEVALRVVREATVAGVVTLDGAPAPGARVPVASPWPAWYRAVSAERRTPVATADASGRFELAGLAPGATTLVAELSATPLRRRGDSLRGVPATLDLAAGARVDGVGLVLERAGAIEGEVLDASGAPAEGWIAWVQRTASASHGAGTSESAYARTDERGRFRVDELEPGSWHVTAIDAARAVDAAGGALAAAFGSLRVARVSVVAGETVRVRLGAGEESTVAVRGRVRFGGEPYADAWVAFVAADGAGEPAFAFAHTAADGAYELELPRPGDYVVAIRRPGSTADVEDTVDFFRSVTRDAEQRFDFELPGGRLSGRVVGPSGGPVAGAEVALFCEGRGRTDEYSPGTLALARTDGEGRWTFDAVFADTYYVGAGGTEELAYAAVGPLELAPGEERVGVDVHLVEPGRVRATVVDASGEPVEGAVVYARGSGGEIVAPLSDAASDRSGVAVHVGLPPGAFALHARAPGLASAESEPLAVRAGATSDVRLELRPATRLRVRLENERGEPVQGWVAVRAADGHDAGGLWPADELEDLFFAGAFSPSEPFFGPLEPGTYSVRADAFGGGQVEREVTLAGESERSITLRFE